MIGYLILLGGLVVTFVLIKYVIHMGNGWNNKETGKLADRIIAAIDSGDYTETKDYRCIGGCKIKADGLLFSFSQYYVRNTWYITDEQGNHYYTGFIQGNKLHKKLKEIRRKEKQAMIK